MNIIVVTKGRGRARQINLKHPGILGLGLLLLAGILVAVFMAGSKYALYSQALNPDARVLAWDAELERQRAGGSGSRLASGALDGFPVGRKRRSVSPDIQQQLIMERTKKERQRKAFEGLLD